MLEQISGNAARFMIYALAILSILLIFLAIYYLINIGNRYIEGKKRISIDLHFITKIFIGILILYLITIIFNKFPILGYTLSSAIIAIIFAYIIDPIVNYLERKGGSMCTRVQNGASWFIRKIIQRRGISPFTFHIRDHSVADLW